MDVDELKAALEAALQRVHDLERTNRMIRDTLAAVVQATSGPDGTLRISKREFERVKKAKGRVVVDAEIDQVVVRWVEPIGGDA